MVSRIYALRCRLGAWLLREHVAALCEHYDGVRTIARAKNETWRLERASYVGIGLRHALGMVCGWRRLDDEDALMMRGAVNLIRHAKEPL